MVRICSWVVILLCMSLLVWADQPQTAADNSAEAAVDKAALKAQRKLQEAHRRLDDIIKSKRDAEAKLKALQQQRKAASSEDEITDLDKQIKKLEENINVLDDHFEEIATGAVDRSKFDEVEVVFDWKHDLEEIMMPILEALKDATEKPREIERQRKAVASYKERMELAKEALQNLDAIAAENLSENLQPAIHGLREQWQSRLDAVQSELEIARYKLDEKFSDDTSPLDTMKEALAELAKGRGLSIGMAILAFATVYVLFILLGKLLCLVFGKRHQGSPHLAKRLMVYGYEIVSFLFAFMALLLVFYMRGDWVLLGVVLLIVAAVILSLRQSLPKYLVELKLLLNIGSVREGERVVYQGIPWVVKKIQVYSLLYNPSLSYGTIRIQLNELMPLNSRPYHQDETWFPGRENDYYLLPDGNMAQVLLQTPELVKLSMLGGGIVNYATADFIQLNPFNLSVNRFGVYVSFGVDYQLQDKSTTDIPEIFTRDVERALAKQAEYGQAVEDVRVEFDQAGASSLDYKIMVTLKGEAAPYYFKVHRDVQRACVDICNREQWSIPFTEITVHQSA